MHNDIRMNKLIAFIIAFALLPKCFIFGAENLADNITLILPNNDLEISEAVITSTDKLYPGPLQIPVNKLGLSGLELHAEEEFSELLQLDLNLLSQIYSDMPSSQHGKILDIDLARKLFPPFDDGLIGANLYSESTHVPASQFINYLFKTDVIRISNEKEAPAMLFLAGGGGSGKGTIGKVLPNIYDDVDLVLDGTLASLKKARDRIQYVLKHGFKTNIIYVFRPVDLAIPGIVQRAMRTGRGVPIVVAAEDHYDAQKTVLALSKEFSDQINIIVINNSGEFNPRMESDVQSFLNSEGVAYKSKDEAISRAIKAYQDYVKNHKITPELKAVLERGMPSVSKVDDTNSNL